MKHLTTCVLFALLLSGASALMAPSPAKGNAPPLASPRAGNGASAASVAQATTYLDRLAAIGFTGAVLVAQDGEILIADAYGWADPARTEPIGPDTIFAIGSNTKPFTAAAILKLQDHGRLRVDDPISRFFAEVPAEKRGVTIHQLLTHSAGFDHSGIFEGDFEQVERDEAVRRILASELLFPPGSESSYADASMILLAAIVELASGRSYEDFLRDEFFAPAGMDRTGFRGDEPDLPGQTQAAGVVGGEPAGRPADLPPLSWSLMGAGGMVSTVEDLYRWHQAVASGAILSSAGQEAYASPHVPLDPSAAEGYGWVIAEPEPGHRLRASAGATEELGHVSVIDWWLDDDLVVIANSANAAYSAEDLAPAIERILFGLPQEVPPVIVPVAADDLRTLAGRYELAAGGAIVVSATADRLFFHPEGPAGFETLFPPDASASSEEGADPDATLAYLESGKEEDLDAWIAEQETTLGPFRQMTVVGTAAPEGGGETWTYVALEFERGNSLTRWVVSPDGVLLAAEIPSEPPAVMFLPSSSATFSSFAPGRADAIAAEFGREEGGAVTLRLTTSTGSVVTAARAD